MSEAAAVSNRRGKWSEPKVPHKGWRCVETDDLGRPSQVCEMCESQPIRFVHHMEHDDYFRVLQVGCVCAGHMAQDLEGARRRDRIMLGRSRQRSRWLSRTWRVSAKGNEWLVADGYRVTVYKKGQAWGATVAAVDADDEFVQHARRTFPTPDRAKLAAFDFVSRLTSRS